MLNFGKPGDCQACGFQPATQTAVEHKRFPSNGLVDVASTGHKVEHDGHHPGLNIGSKPRHGFWPSAAEPDPSSQLLKPMRASINSSGARAFSTRDSSAEEEQGAALTGQRLPSHWHGPLLQVETLVDAENSQWDAAVLPDL